MNKLQKHALKLNKRWLRMQKVKGIRKFINKGQKRELAWSLMQTML